MTVRILILTWAITVVACKPSDRPQEQTESQVLEENLYTPVMVQIGQMIDSSFSSDSDFGALFESYLVEESGAITPVKDSVAIDTYLKITGGEMNPVTQAPIFEIRGSDSIVLMVNEKKVRAHILLDKNSMTIQGIYFPTGSEVNKLGSNVDKFSQQLAGSAINFSADNFELKPWDDQMPAKGDVIIDGISGATKICQASVDMLNNQLPFYHAYFEAN
jgi:hypothetical protein